MNLLLNNSSFNGIKPFKEALEELFSRLAPIAATEKYGIHPNEDLFHSILNIVSLQSNCNKVGSEVTYGNKARADIILTNSKSELGMIVEVKFDKSAQLALIQSDKYLPNLKGHANVKMIKSLDLGINILTDKKVSIESNITHN